MRKISQLLFGLLLLIAGMKQTNGQILDISPVFPSMDDSVTIIYNATAGNGELTGVSPVYAHTGVLTQFSNSPTDWKHVQGNWGTADPNVLMTDLGNNLHEIKYHIRSYYNIPMTDTATSLTFVFRNADGTQVGRDTDGSDIYYPIYDANELNLAFLNRADGEIVELNQMISIEGATSDSGTVTLFENGVQVAQAQGTSISYNYTPTASGNVDFMLQADNGTDVATETIRLVARGEVVVQDPPAGVEHGINYVNDSTVVLVLWAPFKDYVYLIGEMTDWQPDNNYYMNLGTDSATWWIELTGLTPQLEYAYQYYVDGDIKIGDPYADKVLDPWNDAFIPDVTYPNLKPYPAGADHVVSVFQTAQTPYQWQTQNWQRPAQDELIVYELLVRDFIDRHDYETLIDTLDYLQKLGINAIELMPIMEFEGNISWGYNPSFFFAPDKYYGTKDHLKAFIDACHSRGIAVILDMVLNHAFGQNSMVRLYWDGSRPTPESPWFNPDATHPFNVGFDFNHESQATQDFADRVLAYWVEEYRFDGYRMDLSKGFTQTNNPTDVGAWSSYDASRIALLKRMADELWSVDPESYFILEHFADNGEEKELADYGMMLWGNLVHNYNEGTMGFVSGSNFQWISHQQRGWNDPHVVGYLESHDEQRLMYKNLEFGNSNGSYNVKNLETALERMELAGAFFFTIPGPKMFWQFAELGYEVDIDFNGRTGPKPIRWEYLDEDDRLELYQVWSALINLRVSNDAFETDDFDLQLNGAFKRIHLNDPAMNVTVLGNFDVATATGDPNFQKT
ncbi:MAG: alpha-amylase family glycosyl hydrolase, partial [Bacteroidota bacterium]